MTGRDQKPAGLVRRRVSTLTANGMVRPCSGSASKRSLQGGINDKEHAMSQKFRGGSVAENRDRECKAR
jgi:hypothetical protein